MTDWKKLVGHYVLPSARPQGYEPGNVYIDNLVSDDLGTEILAVLNERFEGVKGIEYMLQEVPKKDQPIRFLNTPRASAINQILYETGTGIHVLSPQEVLKYFGICRSLDDKSIYADTDSVLLGCKSGPNEKLRKSLIKDIGVVSSSESLLVSGLGVEKSNDKPGFTLRKTDRTQIISVYLVKELAETAGIPFYYDDKGLRGVVRSGDDMCAYWDRDGLFSAGEAGRVQVLRAA